MQGDQCYVCQDGHTSKWIGCGSCHRWAHLKCVHLNGVKAEETKYINWSCKYCYSMLSKFMKEFGELKQDMTKALDESVVKLEDKIKELKQEVIETKQMLVASSNDPETWVDVVKKKKKLAKKNLLVVKTTDENVKATDMKSEVSQALGSTQISDARFMKGGNIVMNFEHEELRDEAAQKLGNVEKLTTMSVKKLKPKIMICNVYKVEMKDKIIENLIGRNDYLKTIPDIENKIEILFDKPAAGGTIHYILKCDPTVREMIHRHQDRVKLEWGVYTVRDRYHTLICYYCQRYGHLEQNCNVKAHDEEPACFKCAGNHRSKDCSSSEKKCINCVRFKKSTADHSANDKCCPVLISEIERIKDRTDHGH